jgi:hypothetical protein
MGDRHTAHRWFRCPGSGKVNGPSDVDGHVIAIALSASSLGNHLVPTLRGYVTD